MKSLLLLLLLCTSLVHADEIGSQYKEQAEAGDPRAQYYLADTYFSSGDSQQAERWAEKAAKGGDIDAMGLLSQILFTRGEYTQAKALAQQATIAGSKRGAIMLARVLVNTQAGKTDYPQAIGLLQTATQDSDSDSAVDAQLLLGLVYANGVEVRPGRCHSGFVVQAKLVPVTYRLCRVLGWHAVPAGRERLYHPQ